MPPQKRPLRPLELCEPTALSLAGDQALGTRRALPHVPVTCSSELSAAHAPPASGPILPLPGALLPSPRLGVPTSSIFLPKPPHHAQSTPPHSCQSSLGDVPRSLPRAPPVRFTSIPCWACPLSLALPTACLDHWGAGHPSCLVPQSRPAAIRLLLPKASPVSTVSKAQ